MWVTQAGAKVSIVVKKLASRFRKRATQKKRRKKKKKREREKNRATERNNRSGRGEDARDGKERDCCGSWSVRLISYS